MSVANADEARKAFNLAQSYRDKGSYNVALKWARKSSSLSASSAATELADLLEKEIATGATPKESTSSATKATGAETHPSASGTHHRSANRPSGGSTTTAATDGQTKTRSFTPEQTIVVKRVIACKAHDYYSILAGKLHTLFAALVQSVSHQDFPLISISLL
jgi:DnaJ family protein B protein 12